MHHEPQALRSNWLGLETLVNVPSRLKGNLINSRARYIREHYDAATFAALESSVSGEAAAYLKAGYPATAWYPYRPLVDLDLAIIAGPMGADWTQMQPFGSEIASYDLHRVYKALIRMSSPNFLLGNAGIAYSLYFDTGKMKAVARGERQVTVELTDGAHARYMCTFGITGWLCGAAELAGATGVVGEHVQCRHDGAGTCRWVFRWD